MMSLKQPWPNWIITLGVFALALIPRVIGLGTFWGTDERYHWQLSNDFLMALLDRDWANTIPQGLPGLTLAWIESVGILFRYAITWIASGSQVSLEQVMALDRPFALLAQRQMVVVLVNTLIVVGLYQLARRIFGTKAALVGAIFIALDPFFLAESRVLRFEALATGFMTLSWLAALLYLKEQRAYALVLSAVFTALAMLTKISALFLLPAVAMLGTATVLSIKPTLTASPFHWIAKYLIWIGLVVFCFWLFWPAMWVTPLETVQEVMAFVERAGEEGVAGRGVFFWGQIYPDDPGYWFYPVALLFRLTPLVLVGVIFAIVVLVLIFKQRWPIRDEAGWQWWGTASLLVYSLLFAFMMTLGAKKYDRYLMPLFPILDLVAGVGWLWVGEWAIRRWLQPKQTQLALGMGWVVLLILQGLTTLPHLPYYYTYYNPLLGGPSQAVNYIRVGFAEGLDQIAAYMERKPNPSEFRLASANSSKLDGLFSGQTIALDNLDGKWIQGDYVLIYISQLQRGKHSPEILTYLRRHEPEYILKLHGLEYAWLYPGPATQYYGGGYKLEGRGTLYGYDFDQTDLAAGESLPVTLYWRNEGQREDDRFFVRLMDLDGYIWTEAIVQPRFGFEAANRQRKAIVESEAVLNLPIGMPPGDYFFKPGFRTSSGEIIGYFELPGHTKPLSITTAETYPSPGTFHPPYPSDLRANDDLTLLGYDLDPKTSGPGSTLWLTLYWQGLTDVTHDYVILLRLLDETQQEIAYWLGRPVRSGYPTTEWKAGQIVQDPWQLTLPPDAGLYDLEIAIFDADTETEVIRAQLGPLTIQSP